MSNTRRSLTMRAAMKAAKAALPTKTVDLIFDADAVDDLADLEQRIGLTETQILAAERQLDDAKKTPEDLRYGEESRAERLTGELEELRDRLDNLTEQADAIRARMPEHTLSVTLQATPVGRWAALRGEYPPQEGVADDEALGVHADEFFPVAVRAAIIDPVVESDAEWDEFREVLSNGEWNRLCMALISVNGRTPELPKSQRRSHATRAAANE